MVVSADGPHEGHSKFPPRSKRDLSPARATLLRLMQRLNFGRLEALRFRDGEPLFDPVPRLKREVKFAGENGPRPESLAADFLLKLQVQELFAYFDQRRDGVIELLEIKHGLPFRMIVEEPTT